MSEVQRNRVSMFPLFALRLRTARLELRLPSEDEAIRLADLAPDDLEVDPAWPSLPGTPRPVGSAVLQWYWRALGSWRLDHWRLPLAVWAGTELVGFQELEAECFATLRSVETSSWLTPSARGAGIGKEMRSAVLSLAFDHLGALVATSGAWESNGPSLGVSRALGYVDNGWRLHDDAGKAVVMRQVILERSGWDRATNCPTTTEGLEACRPWFGAD